MKGSKILLLILLIVVSIAAITMAIITMAPYLALLVIVYFVFKTSRSENSISDLWNKDFSDPKSGDDNS